jgi:hypothetical protein
MLTMFGLFALRVLTTFCLFALRVLTFSQFRLFLGQHGHEHIGWGCSLTLDLRGLVCRDIGSHNRQQSAGGDNRQRQRQ